MVGLKPKELIAHLSVLGCQRFMLVVRSGAGGPSPLLITSLGSLGALPGTPLHTHRRKKRPHPRDRFGQSYLRQFREESERSQVPSIDVGR